MSKYLFFLFLLASCANPKKLHKMMDKMPIDAAKECAQRYPIKERIDTVQYEDTELLRAYEDEFNYMSQMIDSLLNAKCDTLYIDKIKEKILKIPCKPEVKYIIKTQENTAQAEALKLECDEMEKQFIATNAKIETELQIVKNKNAKLLSRNIWMWLIIILLTLFSFRRQIFNLVK